MLAVIKDLPQPGISFKEVPKPKLGRDQVLVKVSRASICGSDLGLYEYTPAYAGFAKLPIIPGHEFAGEVVEVSPDVSEFDVGERVVAESVVTCNRCKYCRSGQANLCSEFKIFGLHTNGGFAEYAVVPVRHIHRLSEKITFQEAALIEPLSVTCHALFDIAKIEVADYVEVIGPGPIGLLAAEVARTAGCANLLITGIAADRRRLDLAGRMGFVTLNSDEIDPVHETLDRTEGLGADIVVVAAGAGKALNQACQVVRKGGKIINIAIYPNPVELTVTSLVRRQVSLLGVYASVWEDYERAITLVSERRVDLNPLVTHTFTVTQAGAAFEAAKSREGCKVQLAM